MEVPIHLHLNMDEVRQVIAFYRRHGLHLRQKVIDLLLMGKNGRLHNRDYERYARALRRIHREMTCVKERKLVYVPGTSRLSAIEYNRRILGGLYETLSHHR